MELFKKRKTNYYYESFPRLCHYAVECSEKILALFEDFDAERIPELKESVHAIEHQGDDAKHEVTEKLTLEFLTPIDREDILHLLRLIDDVTDAVEEISQTLYVYDFKSLPEGTLEFMKIVHDCLVKTEACLAAFPEFSKKGVIEPYLNAVLSLEEEADAVYEKHMRGLYSNEKDPLRIHKAERIYDLLEDVTDSCREVAKAVETVMFKNL